MMASVVVGGNRKKSLTLRGVDPETCMIVFKNHWAQVITSSINHPVGLRLSINQSMDQSITSQTEKLTLLLLFLWSLRRQFTEDMKLEQLRMYQMLLSQAKQPLLHHKPVLRPLMMLLASGGVVEAELVLLLYQLCVALVKDPSVLELFFHTSEDQGAANFLLFSLLIPYTHRQGSVGQQARDALLLIMSLSASEPRVAHHIGENTYFCPVLATGLSGLYSSLPARLQVYSEDWHCLDQADWQQVTMTTTQLMRFITLPVFICSSQVAHPSIRSQLLGYIYNGFLVPVLAPALHKLTVEEVMTTTAYLDLFLRSISEPALLQTFLSFILLHTHDNVHILDTLVSRLGTVSLALFRTLIGLFCEDVMLQLVFRYLIPCSHLSRKQRSSLKQRDCYSSSAASFLLLMPSWCPVYIHNANTHSHSEHIHWPKGAGQCDSHMHEFIHTFTCVYTNVSFLSVSELSVSDSVGYCRGSDFLMDVNYLHYLWDARQAIATSHRLVACRLWSAPYDGINPSSEEYQSDTPGDDVEDEEEIVQRVKSDSISSLVITPPPSALSPTPSSSDTISMGNQAGRASSALELEWDDIFADDDPSSSALINTGLANGGVTAPPPLPPQHIQEMRRSAIKLVHGSYVEESEFEDDVLVYDLVAQKDTKAALLERLMAANRRARGGSTSNGQRVSTGVSTATITTMLTTTGRTVMETVNSIMTSRRRSEDGGKEERSRSEDYGKEVRRIEDCGKEIGRRKEEEEDEKNRTDVQVELKGNRVFTNGFNGKNHIIEECDDADEEAQVFKKSCNVSDFATVVNHKQTTHQQHVHHNTQRPKPCSVTNTLPNGHYQSDPVVSATKAKPTNLPSNKVAKNDDFLSQYHELMLSFGVEPDCDDITDNIGTFRKRVRALRQKLEEEEEGHGKELGFGSSWDDGEEEGEEEAMEEEDEEEEGEETGSSGKKGSSRHGVPFTGPFISVLLSRLENLLENSIAVNLLVTGILAQLASYPQPLLRSFLLSTDTTHNQPNVRTLYQVTSKHTHRICLSCYCISLFHASRR
uniref:Protein FAM160A1-like n=1 Tax=Seriola lalandi dorsalis TaxID=1841481 RepID=A0A3B4XA20_SERLL